MLPMPSRRLKLPAADVTALRDAAAFVARDDMGVEAGEARIDLDLTAVDALWLGHRPDPRAKADRTTVAAIAGDRRDFEENLIDDFSKHPWPTCQSGYASSVLTASRAGMRPPPRK